MRTTLIYAQVAVLTIAALVFALDLGRADLRVPLDYSVGGDVFLFLPLYKAIAETGWYTENPALGAPGVMQLYDFPMTDNGLFLGVKILILLTGEPFVAGNLLFLGGFVLAAWAAVFVLRAFSVQDQVAAAAGLLFAFLPYHFWRGTFHPNLSFYVAIPLITSVALWLCAAEALVFRRDQTGRLRWALSPRRTVPAVGACVLAALSGPYYAFFGMFLLLTGGLIGFLRRPGVDRVFDPGALAGLLVIGFAAQLIPNALYSVRQGVNPAPSFRPLGNYYQYSLRAVNLLRPVPGHRITALSTGLPPGHIGPPADLAWLRNETNEAETATSLGTTASCGFLILVIFGLAAPCIPTRSLPALGDLAHLNLAALCLGLLGGFGELMALFVTTKIRCYNRISIFIAFFALFALALIWDRPGQAGGRDAIPRRGWRPGWLALLWGMTALGLLDQIPPLLTPNHARDAAAFRSDRAFIAEIERSLPQESMIFQLPPNSFPEFGRHFQMYDYDHFRGYLHSHHLRWSFGALRGREAERWQSRLAPLPPAKLVDRLVEAGFAGIYVARKGHETGGQALIQGLETKLAQPPLTSADGQLLFFRLPVGGGGTAQHVGNRPEIPGGVQ